MGINASAAVYLESLYVEEYKEANIDFVIGYRLWVLLTSDSVTDSFLENCEESFGETSEQNSRTKRPKLADDRSSWKSIKRADVPRVISQIYYGQLDELADVEYSTHNSAPVNVASTLDSDSEEEDEDGVGGGIATGVERNEKSILFRMGLRMFSDEVQLHLMKGSGMPERCTKLDTYVSNGGSNVVFHVAEGDASRFHRLNGGGKHGTWIKPDADILDGFVLPHVVPLPSEVRTYLMKLAHIVGGKAAAIRKMTDDEIMSTARKLLPPTELNPREPIRRSATATALTWSGQTVHLCLPLQAAVVAEWTGLREKAMNAWQSGRLTGKGVLRIDEEIIEFLSVLFSPGLTMDGLPEGYQRVRQAWAEDALAYKRIKEGHSERSKRVLKDHLFPKPPPSNMSWQTHFLDQVNYFLQAHAGLNGQQALIGGTVWILSFLVDYSGFGKPCSVQAEGPPGLGKSYIMKVLCEIINAGKILKMNNYSVQAYTYPGMFEQTVLIMDENVNQGAKSGSTTDSQSRMCDGYLSRARANAELGRTEMWSTASRFVEFAACNYRLNPAMASRYIRLPVTSEGREKGFGKKSKDYAVLCLAMKIITGMTSAPWLFDMMKLCEADDDLYDLFCEMHATVYEDSVLKQNPRLKEMVGTMALATSLFLAISLYHRTQEKELAEIFSLDLLQWLQVNWIVDPYSIWYSYSAQCKAYDVNRKEKVLSWLKNNLRKTAAGTIDFVETNTDYLITDYIEHDSRLESQADAIGLGIAILEEVLNELSVKKGAALPSVIRHSVGKSTYFCVHRDHIKGQKTLTAAEKAIVDLLMSKKAQRHASADLSQWVYPKSVKLAITKNHLRPPSLSGCTEPELEQALTDLGSSFGFNIYGDSTSGLRGAMERNDVIATVDPIRLATSKKAAAGSILDTELTNEVYYTAARTMAGGCVVNAVKMTEYEDMLNGNDKTLVEAKRQEQKLLNTFFTAVGAADGELIYNGVGDKSNISEYLEVELLEDDVKIPNPAFVCKKRGSQVFRDTDAPETVLFNPMERHVVIHAGNKFAAKLIKARSDKLYYNTDHINRTFVV